MDVIKNTALVLEGGGFRGIYSAGVLDCFLKNKVYFPYVIGVSAGAAYGISYASVQFERNRLVNKRYTADHRYMSWRNWIRTGDLFNPDFIYNEIPNTLVPFDFDRLSNSFCDFNVVVTNVESGKAEYYSSKNLDKQSLLRVIHASGSLPLVSNMVDFNNQKYLDGGISDSIPIDKAFADGYSKAVVVLTRNADYRKDPPRFKWIIKKRYAKYPRLVNRILSRAEEYNKVLDKIAVFENEGKVFVIRPKQHLKVSRLENNPLKLDMLYEQGYSEMQDKLDALKEWIKA